MWAVGGGISKFDGRRERLGGVIGMGGGRKWFQVTANNGDLDAQQISLMPYLNHRLHSVANSLEMSKVAVIL